MVDPGALPSYEERAKEILEDERKRREYGLDDRHLHQMNLDFVWEYSDRIAELANCDQYRPACKKIFSLLHTIRSKVSCGYREYEFDILNNDEIVIKSNELD